MTLIEVYTPTDGYIEVATKDVEPAQVEGNLFVELNNTTVEVEIDYQVVLQWVEDHSTDLWSLMEVQSRLSSMIASLQ